MPVYEYRCDACGKDLEAIQKFSDAPLTDCEGCGEKATLKKLISKSSFALKGSGWYTTDYKKSSAPAVETSTATQSAEPAKTEPAKTEPAKTDTPKAEPAKTEAPKKAD